MFVLYQIFYDFSLNKSINRFRNDMEKTPYRPSFKKEKLYFIPF